MLTDNETDNLLSGYIRIFPDIRISVSIPSAVQSSINIQQPYRIVIRNLRSL